MKFLLHLGFLVVVAMGVSQVVTAQSDGVIEGSTGGVTTLLARDPLWQSLCLRDGGPGLMFQQGEVRNRCSDLNFNSYLTNGLSVGVEGSRQGVIIDLGTTVDLKARYGYQETVSNGQGFASMAIKNGKAMILKDFKTRQLQEMSESEPLFKSPVNSLSTVAVQTGHVYLLRITDAREKDFELVAKLLVVAYVPNESVKIRWRVISESESAKDVASLPRSRWPD
jgi:hypothetical protein